MQKITINHFQKILTVSCFMVASRRKIRLSLAFGGRKTSICFLRRLYRHKSSSGIMGHHKFDSLVSSSTTLGFKSEIAFFFLRWCDTISHHVSPCNHQRGSTQIQNLTSAMQQATATTKMLTINHVKKITIRNDKNNDDDNIPLGLHAAH